MGFERKNIKLAIGNKKATANTEFNKK